MTTLMFADTYKGDIQSEAKKISQTKVYVGQIKRKSFVLNQMNRSVILYTLYWSTNDPSKYDVDNFQTNPKEKYVYLVFGR